jgi:hypothetical protein
VTHPEPANVRHLPIDPRRRTRVPWFVAWKDGKPEYRITDKLRDAIRFNLCWVCGRVRGVWGTFVLGPMCGVNRVTAEPPCHHDCAVWSVRICPFLTRPNARRRPVDPAAIAPPPGIPLLHNPGVALLWTTRIWRAVPDGKGALFHVGPPSEVQWWCEGRPALRKEVTDAIEAGMPALRELAAEDGCEGLLEVEHLLEQLQPLLPVGP